MPYLTKDIHDQTAIIRLDQPGEKVNTLNTALIEEFNLLFEQLSGDHEIKAVILISGKENGFIAGADLNLLKTFSTPEEVDDFNKRGNEILDRIAGFEKPVVAAINGACLGGGLEVALACDYRIASTDQHTKFGFPEVKLGLLPGGGGTQRLPRLIGPAKSLDMLLTGKNVYPVPARKMGLVDELAGKSQLLLAALDIAGQMAQLNKKELLKKKDQNRHVLEDSKIGRKLIFAKARDSVQKETNGNYPAPMKIIECVETGIEHGYRHGREMEARYFTELLFTEQARQLINLFFAIQSAGKYPLKTKPQPVTNVGILGAGLMGSGIADVTLREAGMTVYLKDRNLETTAGGMKNIWNDLEEKKAKHIIGSFEADKIISRLVPASSYSDLKFADLVIEAVFEDLDIKHSVLEETESVVSDRCVIASNTSSLPISLIAENVRVKERIIGMHYFSPVPKMPLLEIIKTPETADWAVATAYQTGLHQGKTVILVNDGPGFYTTRILASYLNEALIILNEGGTIEMIDDTMVKFGFPVGPFKLMDEVGIDIAVHVTEVLESIFKKRGIDSGNMARKILDAGIKGRKNGKGFYTYEGKKRKGPNDRVYSFFENREHKKIDSDIIRNRMSLMMVNEAVLCFQENILTRPVDGDVGAVLGLGFPPFLGGPFRYLDKYGIESVLSLLEHYRDKYGVRFEPAGLLREQVKKNRKFYSDYN